MGRYALLIGVTKFDDPKLGRLNAPARDVTDLAALLKNSEIGAFDEVETCIDEDLQSIKHRLSQLLLVDRRAEDTVLLYYSGHGILTKGRKLFLATQTTSFDLPQTWSISASDLKENYLESSRARTQLVILDCCHSGAFGTRTRGGAAVTDDTFGVAEGQYVLTATDALQFAYDDKGGVRDGAEVAVLSQFTGWLIDGLKGAAAPHEQVITLDDLFSYVERRARREAVGMTPKLFAHDKSGTFVIAKNSLPSPDSVSEASARKAASSDWRIQRHVLQSGELNPVSEVLRKIPGNIKSILRNVTAQFWLRALAVAPVFSVVIGVTYLVESWLTNQSTGFSAASVACPAAKDIEEFDLKTGIDRGQFRDRTILQCVQAIDQNYYAFKVGLSNRIDATQLPALISAMDAARTRIKRSIIESEKADNTGTKYTLIMAQIDLEAYQAAANVYAATSELTKTASLSSQEALSSISRDPIDASDDRKTETGGCSLPNFSGNFSMKQNNNNTIMLRDFKVVGGKVEKGSATTSSGGSGDVIEGGTATSQKATFKIRFTNGQTVQYQFFINDNGNMVGGNSVEVGNTGNTTLITGSDDFLCRPASNPH